MAFDENDNVDGENTENMVVETVYVPKKPYTPAKDYSRMGFGFLAFWLMWQILILIIGALYLFLSGAERLDLSTAILLSCAGEGLSFPVYLLITKKISYERLSYDRLSFGRLFIYIGVVFFLGIAGNIIGIVINSVISSNGGTASVSNITDYIEHDFALMLCYAVFAGPVIEEFLCRKILIDRLYRYGKSTVMVASGIIFALLHGNLEQFFYTFFVGCFFAYIYIKTGRIRYSIILHMIMNGFSLILTYVLSKIPALSASEDASTMVKNIMSDDTQAVMILVLIAMVLFEYGMAIAGLIYCIVRFREFSFGSEDSSDSAPVGKCFINPGMTILIVVLFLDMMLTVMDTSFAELLIGVFH